MQSTRSFFISNDEGKNVIKNHQKAFKLEKNNVNVKNESQKRIENGGQQQF